MNLQQLEYVIAVAELRHFARAAERCHVTQPTLSTMIQKLEEQLGCRIFDRSRQPVMLTETGERLVAQARIVLREAALLKEMAGSKRLQGDLRLGIIPTLAPYLLPLILRSFHETYPEIRLYVYEMTTQSNIRELEAGHLDAALLALPLHNESIREEFLFDEAFYVYAGENSLPDKQYLLSTDLDPSRLWLLEEGHCLRTQVMDLCELRKREDLRENLHYESGSIESLLNMVDHYGGYTIVPALALQSFEEKRLQRIRPFADPVPGRKIGLVTYRHYIKEPLLQALKEEILTAVSHPQRV